MLPADMLAHVETWGRKLGVGKNGFLSMAAARLLVDVAPLDQDRDREELLHAVQDSFNDFVDARLSPAD